MSKFGGEKKGKLKFHFLSEKNLKREIAAKEQIKKEQKKASDARLYAARMDAGRSVEDKKRAAINQKNYWKKEKRVEEKPKTINVDDMEF